MEVKMITILFLAANPSDTIPLRLDEEIRTIDERLRRTEFRDIFEIKQHWAVRVADLQECFLRHRPNIVHFSGHGSKSSEIILQDNSSKSQPVLDRTLSNLFSILKDDIRCVVLNACYSEKQAHAIAEHIECVVGMSQAITDSAALSFASSFYQALGYGRSIKTAFDLGCGQIDMEGLGEHETPKLLTLHCNPSKIVLLPKSKQSLPFQQESQTLSRIRLISVTPTDRLPLIDTHDRLITIGRDPKSIVRVPDQDVSWEHGQIVLMQGAYYYRHLSKTNPSVLRRRGNEFLLRPGRGEEVPLRSHDRLSIGKITFIIEIDLIAEGTEYTTTEKKPREA